MGVRAPPFGHERADEESVGQDIAEAFRSSIGTVGVPKAPPSSDVSLQSRTCGDGGDNESRRCRRGNAEHVRCPGISLRAIEEPRTEIDGDQRTSTDLGKSHAPSIATRSEARSPVLVFPIQQDVDHGPAAIGLSDDLCSERLSSIAVPAG